MPLLWFQSITSGTLPSPGLGNLPVNIVMEPMQPTGSLAQWQRACCEPVATAINSCSVAK